MIKDYAKTKEVFDLKNDIRVAIFESNDEECEEIKKDFAKRYKEQAILEKSAKLSYLTEASWLIIIHIIRLVME